MVKTSVATVVLLFSLSCAPAPRTVVDVLRDAEIAMGAANLTSIQYSGSMSEFGVGQSERADGPWPRIFDAKVTYATDFAQRVTHVTAEILPTSPNVPPPPPPGAAGEPPPGPPKMELVINAASPWMQQINVWMTPWGFLKGAAAYQAAMETRTVEGKTYAVVSWSPPQKAPSGMPYRVSGFINDQHMVERVETWIEHPLFGDMPIEATFSEYRDSGGVKVPGKVVQRQGGWPRVELTIATATPNPQNIAQLIKAPARGGGPPPGSPGQQEALARSERLAPGVHRITGGYVALAIEFGDHMVIIEGPEGDARAQAIIAEAKRAIPNKPIKYVVNTHHHDDHAGGLPAFAAEGVTILTHENNRALLERALAAPRTLAPDRLAASKRTAQFETVGDLKILKDATRVVELHHMKGLQHADGMLIAYLPREKIIVQADMAFIFPFPLPREGRTATLVENLKRLKLDYDTVVFVHAPEPDRRVSKADLMKLAAEGY